MLRIPAQGIHVPLGEPIQCNNIADNSSEGDKKKKKKEISTHFAYMVSWTGAETEGQKSREK